MLCFRRGLEGQLAGHQTSTIYKNARIEQSFDLGKTEKLKTTFLDHYIDIDCYQKISDIYRYLKYSYQYQDLLSSEASCTFFNSHLVIEVGSEAVTHRVKLFFFTLKKSD